MDSRKLIAIVVGIVTTLLLFPFSGGGGCGGGARVRLCEDWSVSAIGVRYYGENAVYGMAIAMGVGIATGFVVYLLVRLVWPPRS